MVTENQKKMCTGCGVCAAICPKKCLKIQLDIDGFYEAVCDEEACIRCGLCDKICPKFAKIESQNPVNVLSVVSNDENTLKTTSSGGLCYEIAKHALAEGKKVCSCVYNYEKHRAEHIVINDLNELEGTKGSKYFQSYTPDAFAQIFDGEDWVVFGSPCQIAGIDAAAKVKKCREKLLLVDFFCHGTPSMNLWEKYLNEQGASKIQKVDFRSKEYGWHTFSLRFTYKNGQTHSDFRDNMFYTFFFNNLCLGESCYSCKFKALKSAADIRVGDFWGKKYKEDKRGVSCCLTFTDRGADEVLELSACCSVKKENVEQVMEEQMHESPRYPSQRKKVLKQLRGKKSLEMINNTTLFFYRVKCKIKSIIGRK